MDGLINYLITTEPFEYSFPEEIDNTENSLEYIYVYSLANVVIKSYFVDNKKPLKNYIIHSQTLCFNDGRYLDSHNLLRLIKTELNSETSIELSDNGCYLGHLSKIVSTILEVIETRTIDNTVSNEKISTLTQWKHYCNTDDVILVNDDLYYKQNGSKIWKHGKMDNVINNNLQLLHLVENSDKNPEIITHDENANLSLEKRTKIITYDIDSIKQDISNTCSLSYLDEPIIYEQKALKYSQIVITDDGITNKIYDLKLQTFIKKDMDDPNTHKNTHERAFTCIPFGYKENFLTINNKFTTHIDRIVIGIFKNAEFYPDMSPVIEMARFKYILKVIFIKKEQYPVVYEDITVDKIMITIIQSLMERLFTIDKFTRCVYLTNKNTIYSNIFSAVLIHNPKITYNCEMLDKDRMITKFLTFRKINPVKNIIQLLTGTLLSEFISWFSF